MNIKEIIWDWNGTLLNDVDLCINSINILLHERKIAAIDKKTYRKLFTFPVKEYYEAIGFDFKKEDFSIPAHQFIDLYTSGFKNCTLHEKTIEVLSVFKERGIRQFVLSAMEHDLLELTLKEKGINHFFEGIAGLQDHYAVSKAEQGKILIEKYLINRNSVFLIGDTIHDFEVANEIGIPCFLIANGHQSADRLRRTGCIVLNRLDELLNNPLTNQHL